MFTSEKENDSSHGSTSTFDNSYGLLSTNIHDLDDIASEVTLLEVDEFNNSAIEHISVIANTINTLLGVSLFATPWGYEESGILLGTIILIVVAILSFETARILLAAQKSYFQRTGEIMNYPDIAEASLGKIWSSVVRIATIISCLGGCTGYLIFFGETLGQVFTLSSESIILFATIPLILLSWIRSFRELTIFTIFGVFALCFAIAVLLYNGNEDYIVGSIHSVPIVKWKTAFNLLGPSTFMFTIHYCLLSMGAEALETVAPVKDLLTTSMHSTGMHGNNIYSNTQLGTSSIPYNSEHHMNSIPHNEGHVLNVSYIPLQLMGSSSHVHNHMHTTSHLHNDYNDNHTPSHSIQNTIHTPHIRRTASITSLKTEDHIPSISKYVGISYFISLMVIGVFGGAAFIFYRKVDYVRDEEGDIIPGCEQHVCQNIILNLSPGNLRNMVGLMMSLVIILSYILLLVPAREHIEAFVMNCIQPSTDKAKAITMNVTRTVLVLGTVTVAVGTPYFGTVLGAIGGFTDALQCFVLPPLIHLALGTTRLNIASRLFYKSVVCVGVCTMVYTCINTYMQIMNTGDGMPIQ